MTKESLNDLLEKFLHDGDFEQVWEKLNTASARKNGILKDPNLLLETQRFIEKNRHSFTVAHSRYLLRMLCARIKALNIDRSASKKHEPVLPKNAIDIYMPGNV
jgi:hypothetical protein